MWILALNLWSYISCGIPKEFRRLVSGLKDGVQGKESEYTDIKVKISARQERGESGGRHGV